MTEIGYADLPGLRMAYRTWGRADGRPLVALHGGAGSGETWAALAAALGSATRTYAPDLRGYGATGPAGAYSLELVRDDVLAFLDALALPRVVMLGHSSGAVAAHLFARAYPDRVAALVLVEPPPPVPLGLRLPPRPAGPLPYDWAAREAVVAELNAPPPTWWEELTEITAPTLVVAGGPASHLPQHELARMAARIPAARLVTVEAGHAVPAARPAEFATAVRDFLAALPR
ncbi:MULTISPECIES: alpha/beta fold hydrolase [Micromonospora]|uniref:alpha/beta fold hydrolase n=1 Tax=Micromonospora TaxID=1873 RepID=UPI0021C61417|nr:alpha/beta hydrolase [Micromonospora sp. Mcm103]